MGVAYWLYGWGLRKPSVPTAVTLTLAEPLTAAVLGVALLVAACTMRVSLPGSFP